MGACMGKGGGQTADQEQAVKTVSTMFGMWGEGKFASSQGEDGFSAAMGQIAHPDVNWDFTGPAPEIYRKYSGFADFLKWMAFLEEFDFPMMKPTFFPGPAGSNIAIMYIHYDMKHKTTGAEVKDCKDIFVFTIKGDKISTAKQYWGDIAGINTALGPQLGGATCTTPDQSAAMGTVLKAFGMWGEGKFKANLPLEDYKANMAATWADDHTFDVRGPDSAFHVEYKSGGKIDGTINWIKFLDSHEFTRMEPVFSAGPPGSGKVTCYMSYDMKYKTAELKDQNDAMVFTVKDGKIASLRQFWGDPVKVKKTFGELWEMPA